MHGETVKITDILSTNKTSN